MINYSSTSTKNDVCVSCLATALKRGRKSVDSALLDDSSDSDISAMRYRHSSISLPTTLKKYKGHNSSAETCRHLSQVVNKRRPSNTKMKATIEGCSSKIKIASSTSFCVSKSCDKMPNTSFSDEDNNLDSVVVSSEHDLEDLERKLNK